MAGTADPQATTRTTANEQVNDASRQGSSPHASAAIMNNANMAATFTAANASGDANASADTGIGISISTNANGQKVMVNENFLSTVPPEDLMPDSIDKVLASEMKALSLQQREQVYEDIHGVSVTIEETEEFLDAKLKEFAAHIRTVQPKVAYDMAFQLDDTFVTNSEFCIMFLRSESFRVQLAAQRMIRHFETKLDLWGKDMLVKEIDYDDLDLLTQEIVYTANCNLSVLEKRDTSDRAVIVSLEKYHRAFFRTDSPRIFNNRILWYFIMAVMRNDETTQKNGVVYICFGLDFVPKMDAVEREVWWGSCAVLNSLPMRVVGFHYCYNSPKLQPFIALVSMGLGHDTRCRVKAHYGTTQECLYALMSFGIPVQEIPITHNGDRKLGGYASKWLGRRQLIERRPNMFRGAIELPARNDVLLGKGKPIQEHCGNKRLHDIVALYYDDYNEAPTRLMKRATCEKVLQVIHTTPAKFLKRANTGYWAEVPNNAALEKIGHCFRRKREVINAQRRNREQSDTQQGEREDGQALILRAFGSRKGTNSSNNNDGGASVAGLGSNKRGRMSRPSPGMQNAHGSEASAPEGSCCDVFCLPNLPKEPF